MSDRFIMIVGRIKHVEPEVFYWFIRGLQESLEEYETPEINDDGTYDWCRWNNVTYIRQIGRIAKPDGLAEAMETNE